MTQDPTISPQRPQVSHPHQAALQSTPQAKGSATISEHISTVGIQVSDVRPWITRDVEKFQECGLDEMLKDLLVGCTGKSRKSVDEAYKTRLFQRCLDKVLPICNGEDQTPVEGMKGKSHEVKETLKKYSRIQAEKELYPVFVQAANTALLFLEELKVEDIRPADDPTICFHVNDPTSLKQSHQGQVSQRKPDVIVVSNKDVCDSNGLLGDIYNQKDRFLQLATQPPVNAFEWRSVRTFVEFKKPKKQMVLPPERYSSRECTPPQEPHPAVTLHRWYRQALLVFGPIEWDDPGRARCAWG
ncbi:hypothetical protein L210DRAFT_3672555 [Boletus edulis BED1]|uniref:Uncharacterized protein n=1 Tax=Boletus edulis BED1 TaxID=1328754 RepID=A0AAD4BE77_BOLED|nr:hypothetical protein L210DRAFT_3672555 [Boletus edulis BED1]